VLSVTCVGDEEAKKERQGKKPDSDRLTIYTDHPRCHSARWICMCGDAREIVIMFQVSSKSVPRIIEIWHLLLTWLLAYTTAWTTVQATIDYLCHGNGRY